MKRGWALVLLGLLAFLILLVATLPARVLIDRIAAVNATGVRGSLWSGHAENLIVQGISLGPAEWRLFALPLLRGRLKVDAKVAPPGGTGTARCAISLSRDVMCSRVQASLPLASLRISSLPQGWSGTLLADLKRLDVAQGWPVAVAGTVDVQKIARTTGNGSSPFGSFQVEFPATTSADASQGITGALHDTGGPLDVIGTLHLAPDHTYVIEGRVAARASAPPNLVRSLEYLGSPDAEGRREFSLAGSL